MFGNFTVNLKPNQSRPNKDLDYFISRFLTDVCEGSGNQLLATQSRVYDSYMHANLQDLNNIAGVNILITYLFDEGHPLNNFDNRTTSGRSTRTWNSVYNLYFTTINSPENYDILKDIKTLIENLISENDMVNGSIYTVQTPSEETYKSNLTQNRVLQPITNSIIAESLNQNTTPNYITLYLPTFFNIFQN